MLQLVSSMLWFPQGSHLSPLLFNIFMNDMNELVTVSSLCLYVKDTTQYAVDSSPFVLQYTLNYIVSSGQWAWVKIWKKRLPQLYYIKTKFLMIWVLLHYWGHHGNAMTALRFLFIFVFLCTWSFFKGSLKGVCPCHNCLSYGKVWTNLWDGFGNILKWSFKSHKNIKIEYANNWVKKWVTYYNITATFC